MFESFRDIQAKFSVQGDMASSWVRWGMLVIALIMLWFFVADPFLVWREGRMDALHSRIAKVERMVSMQQGADRWISAEEDYAKAIQAIGPLFLEGDSYAVAQNKFMALVRQQAMTFHMLVKSQHLRDSEPVSGLGEAVGVDLQLQGHLGDALSLVDALVRAPRILTIDSLYIAPVQGMPVSARGERTVVLMIGVQGYRLTGQESQ